MKKFLLPLMLAFAILIPTIQVSAADVPNFRRVAGDSVRGGKSSNEKGYHIYSYTPRLPLTYNGGFVDEYINLLKENGLTLIDHSENVFRSPNYGGGSVYYNYWFFDCRGYRVTFKLVRGFDTPDGYTTFSVKVANELTYEEDF